VTPSALPAPFWKFLRKETPKEKPFILPRPLLHVTDAFWKNKDAREFMLFACDVANQMGNTCFVFDRTEKKISSVQEVMKVTSRGLIVLPPFKLLH